MKKYNIAIILVSFNRKKELLNNLEVIKKITKPKFDVIVVDNDSTDGTKDALINNNEIIYLNTGKNIGGAGGFKYGMQYVYEKKYEYIWCLDDDGEPDLTSLDILLKESIRLGNCSILGPQILSDKKVFNYFWPINKPYDSKKKRIELYTAEEQLRINKDKLTIETASVALMGMFMHRDVIKINNYPDEQLFVSNDDVEYCLRAKNNGIKIFLINSALVYHPALKTIDIGLLNKKISIILMSDIKLYYYVRNIILINKKYFSLTNNLKGFLILLVTIVVNFVKNKYNVNYLFAGVKGIYHGLVNRNGKK